MKRRKKYSRWQAKKALHHFYALYRKKEKGLSDQEKSHIQNTLLQLQEAIDQKNQPVIIEKIDALFTLTETSLKKNVIQKTIDSLLAIVFALAIAFVIRQVWFELYNIPTGSMRPTLKEKDFLVVSKSKYSINTIGKTKHLYFDPDLVKRGSIVVFSAHNLDVTDPDTMYLWLIPGTKQFIKRLIAKPGDTVYYYGGLLYGIDKDGNEIKDFDTSYLTTLEHIPFIHFDGKLSAQGMENHIVSPIIHYQTGIPVAKLSLSSYGLAQGALFPFSSEKTSFSDYYKIWGMENYAMARILTKEEAQSKASRSFSSDYVLEMMHHPSIHPVQIKKDPHGYMRPQFSYTYSYLPLDQEHMQMIHESLYTARFHIKNNKAYKYSYQSSSASEKYLPSISAPNGTYEFQDGKIYSVNWLGIARQLSEKHLLKQFDPQITQSLYNLGFDFDTRFTPQKGDFFPSRYAYFRNGSFYLMGRKIFDKNDPVLKEFIQKEKEKTSPYHAFIDQGPPIKTDGSLDKDFILTNGLKLPEKMYLVLGDNHAMSADSRDFGFCPEENLRGTAGFLFWPIGSRWGFLFQPSSSFFTFPNVIVWLLALIISFSSYWIIKNRREKPITFKK